MPPRHTSSSRIPGIESLAFVLRGAEPALIIVSSVLAYWLRHGRFELPSGYAALTLLAPLFYLLLAAVLGVFQHSRLRQPLLVLPSLLGALFGAFALMVGLLFLFKVSSDYSRVWLVTWLLMALGGLLCGRIVVWQHLRRQLKAGRLARRVAVLGDGEKTADVLASLAAAQAREVKLYGVYGLYAAKNGDALAAAEAYKGDLAALMNDGLAGRFDELIVALDLDRLPAGSLSGEQLLTRLHGLAVNVHYCLPRPLFGRAPQGHPLFNLPLVLLYRKPLEGHSRWLKRMLDIAVSLIVLVLLSPVLAITALLVKLSSAGPVFFKQPRGGFSGQTFEMIKFRSMRVAAAVTDASGKEKQASKDDARITPVGRFIRRTSIDELPQLWNVLRGDMSLVGPRPHVPSHNSYYENLVDRYASRHKMRPGLTGWAQLNGLRGETDTLDKMAKRVEMDIWYVENWSLGLDLKIILLTPFVLLFQKQAY